MDAGDPALPVKNADRFRQTLSLLLEVSRLRFGANQVRGTASSEPAGMLLGMGKGGRSARQRLSEEFGPRYFLGCGRVHLLTRFGLPPNPRFGPEGMLERFTVTQKVTQLIGNKGEDA